MGTKFKSGAASFYVVAFSTLILVIIAASFATAIIAEVVRTTNDDLSQSAYDAALAGVEDAKLAFINYQNCIKSGVTIDANYKPANDGPITCQDIIYWMEHPDCDMVAHILGRIGKGESGEVLIEETAESDNEMNQAYTCAMVQKNPSDYRATLSSGDPYKIVKVSLADGVRAAEIKSVRISWYSNENNLGLRYNNVLNGGVVFPSLDSEDAPAPPTIAVRLLQTAEQFILNDLNGESRGNTTDRATVYLVPASEDELGMANNSGGNYVWTYNNDKGKNILTAAQVASTNNREKNLPYVVYCPKNSTSGFMCSATLELPDVINGTRSDDTFMFVVALPYTAYGQPDTDFAIEYFCGETNPCGHDDITPNSEGLYENNVAATKNIQITVDSTGRANDLYRRVEVRLGPEDSMDANAFSWYAIQAFDEGDSAAIDKNKATSMEYNSSDFPIRERL